LILLIRVFSQVLHQATLSRQFIRTLRTQHGIICPECTQEVTHACSSLSTPPLGRYEHQQSSSSANPTGGLQTHFTGATAQDNLLGEQATAYSAAVPFQSSFHVQPSRSEITSNSTNSELYPPTFVPDVPSSSGVTSYTPPCLPVPSIAFHSQYNSSNSHSWLGQRDLRPTDLKCETIPEALVTSPEDGDVTSEQESGTDWSIKYNTEVKRELDLSFVCSLDMEEGGLVRCVKFSKDGKYLAVGHDEKAATDIYDAKTGEKIL
jgi:hypothetical protein